MFLSSLFRPDFLKIKDFRTINKCPCVALTATANKSVQKDVVLQLNMENLKTFTASVFRFVGVVHEIYLNFHVKLSGV